MPTPTYDTALALPAPITTVAYEGLNPFVFPDLVFADGRLYWFFGADEDNRVWDGSTLKVMSGVPDTLPTVSAEAASGAGETGLFWYTYTLYDPDADYETGPAANLGEANGEIWASVTLAAQDATFNVPNPASGSRFTRARVYRSIKGTLDLRQLTGTGAMSDLVLIPGAGGNVAFHDTFVVSDATLRTRINRVPLRKRFRDDGLPPRASTGMFFGGRLYIDNPDRPGYAFYSELSPDIEDVLDENEIPLVGNATDTLPRIRKMAVVNGERYIYSDQGIYLVFGVEPPFGIRCVYSGEGAVSMLGCKFIEGLGVVFATESGLFVHRGGDNVVPVGVVKEFPAENPVDDLYLEYDAGRLKDLIVEVDAKAGATKVTFGTNGSPVNDRTLVNEYLVPGGSGWSMDDGRSATCRGYLCDKTGRSRPVFGDELGQVWQEDLGNAEGFFGTTFSSTVDTATRTTLALNQALTAIPNNPKGMPLFLLDPTTGEILYRNRILSFSGSALVMLYPWEVDDLTDLEDLVAVAGGIDEVWETGYLTLFPDRMYGKLERILLYLVKGVTGQIARLLFGTNQQETLRVATKDLPLTDVQRVIRAHDLGVQMKIRVESCRPGDGFGLQGYDLAVTRKNFQKAK